MRRAVATAQGMPTAMPISVSTSVSPKRSEEHTSELQSRLHLVCRLLLAKKKRSEKHRRQTELFLALLDPLAADRLVFTGLELVKHRHRERKDRDPAHSELPIPSAPAGPH